MPHPSPRPSRARLSHLLASSLLLAPVALLGPAWAQSTAPAQAPAQPTAPAQAPATDPLFTRETSLYDTALQDRVSKEGLVDYAKLKGDRNLAAFVAALPLADVSNFPVFPARVRAEDADKAGKNAKDAKAGPQLDRSWELAFWINAHNALLLKALADAYPISSPDDVKNLSARKFPVAGGSYTLEEIRARASRLDRRAPFAMIDGTQTGPKMAPRAVRAYTINSTLDSLVSALVNDSRSVELQRIQNKVTVSPFLSTVDALWKPRTAGRKWDGIRSVLSLYTAASPDRNYFTTNRYEVLLAPGDRRLNRVPSEFAG